MLTAALDVMFPALYLANSWLSYILELASRLCQNASFERPSSLLPLPCDNLILSWSHWSKKRPSFDILNRMLNSLLYFAMLVSPNQARVHLCRVWGSMGSWDKETFRSRRFWDWLTPGCGYVNLGVRLILIA